MKIDISDKGTVCQTIRVKDIQGDMGETETLFLFQEADGDVIVGITTDNQLYSLQFCTSQGGGRNPIIAKKLRELIAELVKANQE